MYYFFGTVESITHAFVTPRVSCSEYKSSDMMIWCWDVLIEALINGSTVREVTTMTWTCVLTWRITGIKYFYNIAEHARGVKSLVWLTYLSSDEDGDDILCYELQVSV